LVTEASLIVFYKYCNYLFIYELDEFELNGMNVYVWYVVSMFVFVNDAVCDRTRTEPDWTNRTESD